ncbi:hypothetical protein [Wolbachia endosymbiont (group A) of Sphecodes monilicornis]|uniref:hypothetical protein n=1 Tax=Wolbachia endosymbiont (group A) of Sphecodes monilicornis TaxID=2954060 RepID=UPI002226F454|nr:hypothetical protein [Wolbachia endosymbiont (group A) of Sphecodes monilicornis]
MTCSDYYEKCYKVWIPASSTGIISFTMSILQYLCSCVSTTFVAPFVIQSLC